MLLEILGIAVLVVGVVAALVLMSRARFRREAKDTATLAESRAKAAHVPPTLHPVIDPDLCIGSLSCLKVCPEGDILGLVNGKATLINAAACIGHGKCALECPVDAIKLVFGTAERGQELPEVDEYFQSSRTGVFVIGELGGMGLIKNAVTQGLQVADFLTQNLGKASKREPADVAIVGAGPAGLSAALALQEAGRSLRLLEQDSVGGTIAHYPRQKVVMTERVDLPFYGKFGKSLISKEELLEAWSKAVRKAGLRIETNTKVTAIKGGDGNFTLETSQGVVRARKVVLACGRRGSPRKLGVPGEDLAKVSYGLIDAEQYDGARVLVVGGGDSALEAAIALCEDSDAKVALSYRNADLGKARDANKRRFKELVAQKKLRALMPSQVQEIRPDRVRLSLDGSTTELANDFVLVCIGGEPPSEFLGSVGVTMRRYHGTALGGGDTGTFTVRRRVLSAKELAERSKTRRLALVLFVVGAIIIAALALVGFEYYLLPARERLKFPLHKFLKSSGPWGHGVGVAATLFMLSNFVYALRKRWRRLKGRGSIRRWLTFHQFVGFMSPLVILFHAAFQSKNVIATVTLVSLLVVVVTGIIGRFIWGLVPSTEGRTSELAVVQARWERHRARMEPLLEGVERADEVRGVLARATAPPRGSVFALLFGSLFRRVANEASVLAVRKLFPSGEHFREFREAFFRLERLRNQVAFYASLRRVMSVWRLLHVVLAVVLVLVIGVHIAVSLYFGYWWILR